jgi:hypothetical protein
MTESVKDMLLNAPDSQLDGCIKPLVQKWNEPATSLQILEVLDNCIYGALASGFTIRILQALYDRALVMENKTHEDNVPLATWRHVPEEDIIQYEQCAECMSTHALHKMDCGSKHIERKVIN